MKQIELTRGQVALVDDDDFERLNQFLWKEGNGYAYTNISNKIVMMHRMIMGLQRGDGLQAHHIHHNKLDNRKSQLKVCTPLQNSHNRRCSGYTA